MKLLSRRENPEEFTRICFPNGLDFTPQHCVMMAGPCAAESRDQVMRSAEFLSNLGVRVFRAGCYKPRTNPYVFQGSGVEGLTWLAEVRDQFGMLIVTELRDETHFDEVEAVADILQIGAKSMFNHALLKACGASKKPVLLKRFFAATVDELLKMADFILLGGNPNVMLCERGIRTFEPSTRFSLDLSGAAILQRDSKLPLILDPSHAIGLRFGVPQLARACAAFGCEGLLIEVHPNVDQALCDKDQAMTHDMFSKLLPQIRDLTAVVGRQLI
jgi:3-deoxy-7-phosphoheptulonate synthase